MRRIAIGLGLGLIAAGAAAVVLWRPAPRPTHPATQVVSTLPSTRAAIISRPVARPVFGYGDVVHADNPAIPATQPVGVPVPLPEAAHFFLRGPVYVCPQRHLWVTSAKAQPTENALAKPFDDQVHVVRDRVLFVHWTTTDTGDAAAAIVAPSDNGAGFQVITKAGRKPLPTDPSRDYAWDRAMALDNQIVVPGGDGVSIFTFDPEPRETHHALPVGAGGPAQSPVVMIRDGAGVLAWSPWDGDGRRGSRGAARYADGKWTDLGPDTGWPERIVQLIALADGTVLQLSVDDEPPAETLAPGPPPMAVRLSLVALDTPTVDEKHITDLAAALGDSDEAKREAAYTELASDGTGAWAVLEKIAGDQPAEAQVRIAQLLKQKTDPALGTITPTNGRLAVVKRQVDGTVIFFAPDGVSIANGTGDPAQLGPSWIGVRPGVVPERLNDLLVKDLPTTNCPLLAVDEDWIVCDAVQSARRWVGNGFVPLSRVAADERRFSEWVGTDQRGRWLFRVPASRAGRVNGQAASSEPTTATSDPITLVIDPTIPDPTPRLPVWDMKMGATRTGWDVHDWPAHLAGGLWTFEQDAWVAVKDDGQDRLVTELPAAAIPTTAASQPADAPPLLSDADGTRYFDGLMSLRIVARSGPAIVWPMPPSATGTGEAHLVRTCDGRLFLFNQPGRVLRLHHTPGAAEPFEIEATFTHNVPAVDHFRRIWLDPAGRIAMAFDANRLVLLFPDGHIPAKIADLMPDEK